VFLTLCFVFVDLFILFGAVRRDNKVAIVAARP
jgi:hypothetical protein